MRLLLAAHLGFMAVSSNTWLLRRNRNRPTRDDAFTAVFDALGVLYESAAHMKPEWREIWENRTTHALPPKFDFGNALARTAAYDMRYATFLLQRYRWKSQVQPLFAEHDPVAWNQFLTVTSSMTAALLMVGDEHIDRFFEDERDWIQSAIEQFDEARRLRALSDRNGLPLVRQIAEGTYLPLYIAIQLSDRFIERLRFEAGKID